MHAGNQRHHHAEEGLRAEIGKIINQGIGQGALFAGVFREEHCAGDHSHDIAAQIAQKNRRRELCTPGQRQELARAGKGDGCEGHGIIHQQLYGMDDIGVDQQLQEAVHTADENAFQGAEGQGKEDQRQKFEH